MSRRVLKELNGTTREFSGVFERFGSTPEKLRVMLVHEIKAADGSPVCHHAWIPTPADVLRAELERGDLLTFRALVASYWKRGYYQPAFLDYGFKDVELLFVQRMSIEGN